MAKLSQIKEIIPNNVSTLFVRQPQQLGLGHAILCAEKAVGNEPFAVLLADDFISGKNTNVISDLIKSYKRSNKNQLSIQEIDKENISKYGVIIPGKSDFDIKGIIEKPNLQDAPSNLASIGRYVLNPQIFKVLRTLETSKNVEMQLTDALDTLAKKEPCWSNLKVKGLTVAQLKDLLKLHYIWGGKLSGLDL